MPDLNTNALYGKSGESAGRNGDHYELINALMDEQEANPSEDRRVWEEMARLCNNALVAENLPPERRARILGIRGYAETKLGRYKEAIATMRAVIDVNPESRWAYETLQHLQFRTRDWIGSMRTTKALASLPDSDDAPASLSAECKRRLTAYALLTVGGVWLIRHLWRNR